MAIARHDEILAATLVLLLSTAGTALAAPENADVPTSVTGTVAAASPASPDADLNSRIPLPEPLNVPPPSANDVTAPAPVLEKKPAPEPQKAEAPAPEAQK